MKWPFGEHAPSPWNSEAIYDHSSMGISNNVRCMSLTKIDEHKLRKPIDLSEQKI